MYDKLNNIDLHLQSKHPKNIVALNVCFGSSLLHVHAVYQN